MELGNMRNVFVVSSDATKDMSEARKFGKLRAVFENPKKPYDTYRLVSQARFVLQNFEEGDYLLMVGDPSLCALCMTVVAETCGRINVLSWDRRYFTYVNQEWNLDMEEEDFNQL